MKNVRKIKMSPYEEAALWRQRYFEAQSGMERFLTERYGASEIERWLPVKAEILKGVESHAGDDSDPSFWKDQFFRTQARLEQYVVEHHGLAELDGWTSAVAEVFRFTEPGSGDGAVDFVLRFAKQAECYRSDYEISHATPTSARVELNRCGIWEYREQARSRGVKLTLESPCTYCTKATRANAQAAGFDSRFELHSNDRGHGCAWEFESKSTEEEEI